MHATYTTLVGRMVTAPEKQTYDSGATRVSFRVACTERRRGNQGWSDGETLYITVRCWRQLADNVVASMGVGDPIIAHGKVYTRSVDREGSRLSVTEMEASAVGPDLRWATAVVTRTKAAAAGAPSGLPEMPVDSLPAGEGAGLEMVLDDPWAAADGGTAVEEAGSARDVRSSVPAGTGNGRGNAASGDRTEAGVTA